MKRRTDCTKFRRPIKKSKIAEGISSNTLLYMKFLILWAIVITADFLLEFRFEFLWPFWLLLRSVHDSFKYKGLVFSILFVCIAFTSDLICLFFIPVQWLFFAASTYVWVQYVWHTDKGVCLPTIILWVVFVYLEAAIRWKDSRNMPHLDLCRPFAAHCIGYPVVTLGFGFKSYVGYRIRQRKQREVAKENDFYMQLLQQALPQEESPPCLAQSDQQLQPQEKDPVVVAAGAAGNPNTSNHSASVSHNYHHKNAQTNNKLLNNNNSTANSLVTNGHAIGASTFGTTSNSSSTISGVISNGFGHHSSSSTNSSSSSSKNRKSVDKDNVTTSLSNNNTGGNSGGGGGKSNTNTFHHSTSNHISLKDRSVSTNDSTTTTSYNNEYSTTTRQHDKDSPKQQQQHNNSHHYQISNHNSHMNNINSNYDEAKSFESSNNLNNKNTKLQNGNLQHDYELPHTVTACQQQQEISETTAPSNNTEKERTKSGRKNRGKQANKLQDMSSSASSSKDNQQNLNNNNSSSSITSTSSSAATLPNNNHTNNTNNTQQDSIFASQCLMFESHNNNKDHQQVPTSIPVKVCESCPKLEADMKKLKSELNIMKQTENDLRQKIESNSTVKSCLQAKQKEYDELHTKFDELTHLRQIERQTMQNLERRLTEERRQRQSLEAQLNNERKYRKQAEEKAARSECSDTCRMKKQQLENEVNKIRREYAAYEDLKHNLESKIQRYEQELRKMEAELRNREQQQHSDLITLNDLRMKNGTLEKNLSAETRVKLDLFSALGDSKREIEIRDSLLRDRNNELHDLKAKIAQLLAVMPTMPTDSFNFATSMPSMPPSSSSGGSSILRLSNDGMQQQQQQQQQGQSISPLAHLGLGGGVNSSLVSQLNLGVLTSTTGNIPTGANNALDPNAKTYTPKSNSSLVGSAEA